MTVDDCYLVGYVVKPHGTKGALLAFIDADDLTEYIQMESILVEQPEGLIPFFVEHAEPASQTGHLILYLEGVETVEDAQKLKGTKLYEPEEALPPLRHDQFYYHEVVGFEVVDAVEGVIGALASVQDMPANPLLVVKKDATEILIPLKEPIYTGIDKEKKQLYVHCPEGLIALYRNEN